MKIGITFGAFDVMHAGHILMLKEAREQCDHLIVGLQTDPTIDRPQKDGKDSNEEKKGNDIKGANYANEPAKNRPVQTVEERRIQLEGCRYVDEIVIYDTEESLYQLLLKIKPDVRIIGADWKGRKYTGYDLPIKMYFNTRNHNYSSSGLRERIFNAELQKKTGFGQTSLVK